MEHGNDKEETRQKERNKKRKEERKTKHTGMTKKK